MSDMLPLGVRARQWVFFATWRLRERLGRLIVPRRTVESRGLSFRLPCDNWITHYRWKTYNNKEPETLDWIDGFRADDVLFDVGANIGLYTLYAALRHPAMRIVSFEPEYSNLHLLRDNVIDNRLDDQVSTFSMALGRIHGVSYLHVQDLHPGSALHTVSNDALDTTRTDRPVLAREGIVQMPLDLFCEQIDLEPSCMKIDVDGGERDVLEGARRTLASESFRSLLIEMSDHEADRSSCAALLEQAGLHRVWHDPRGATRNEIWNRP